jgi:predicted TIM-barrel fold metal-dependent hydrolase
MAIDFYGRSRMLYGSDNPCWKPLAALEATRSLGLSDDELRAVMDGNVRRLMDLGVPAEV